MSAMDLFKAYSCYCVIYNKHSQWGWWQSPYSVWEVKEMCVSVSFATETNKPACFSLSVTFDTEHGGALCPSQRVLRCDGVLAHVFGPHSQDQHGANPARVGDVIVGIGVQADVISIPRDTRLGVAAHRAAHVAFVAFGCSVKLQRHDERRGALQVTVPHGRQAHHKLFCKTEVQVGICCS